MADLVSIITPCKNSEKFIAEAIKSVLSQSYTNWEMLIVDDNSTDKTQDIIQNHSKKDGRIRLIKNTETGVGAARNTAIKASKGRYIAFLDSDDLWFKDKLKVQIKFMIEQNLAFTYSAYQIIDERGKTIGNFTPKLTNTYKSLLKTCDIGCLTAIFDTQILGKMYMPNFQVREDYALWLEIFKKIGSTKGIKTPLASYRVQQNSLSANKLTAALYQWKTYRTLQKLSPLKSTYYLAHYAINGIKKRL